MADSPQLHVQDTAEAAAGECADFILGVLSEKVQTGGHVSIAISGGSTPKLLFAAMAKAKFDWSRVDIFWVDERCVPPMDKESNFKLANDYLLTPAGIASTNVHRIYGEMKPEEGAARYVSDIATFFGLRDGQFPAFDILHRGMGPDAHTASLFPGDSLVYDRTGIATNVWVEKFKMHRVTLLPAVLVAAKQTVLQVSGSEKAEALRAVLTGPEDLLSYPCQIASRDARAVWFVDKAAAAKL